MTLICEHNGDCAFCGGIWLVLGAWEFMEEKLIEPKGSIGATPGPNLKDLGTWSWWFQ